MKDLGKKIDVLTKDMLPDLIQLRRHLHAHPELSGQEYQTAAPVSYTHLTLPTILLV